MRLDPLDEDMEQTPSQTDRPRRKTESKASATMKRQAVDDLGESESVDPENLGDIADEGTGRRG